MAADRAGPEAGATRAPTSAPASAAATLTAALPQGLDAGWDLPDEGAGTPTAALFVHDGADDDAGDVPPVRLREPAAPPRDPDGDDVFAELQPSAPPRAGLVPCNVMGVRLRSAGRLYECDAGDRAFSRGERVVIEGERGPELGIVAVASGRRLAVPAQLRAVLRRAEESDRRALERNAAREREAQQACREALRARRLPMKLVRVEYALTGARAVVYFASEERVDHRDLVRDLGQRLRARVELRQLGARDEAKAVGGIGDCGRELCCTTFLPRFEPVSIKMAKDQGLVLNPTRLAGQCGRLKCCLVYEHQAYQELRKGLPKVGKRVSTPEGEGRVAEVDVLRQRIRVAFGDGGSQTFPAASVAPVAAVDAPSGGPPPLPSS